MAIASLFHARLSWCAGRAVASLFVTVLLVASCESGYLTYENTRIGLRLGADEQLEVLSFGCVSNPASRVWVDEVAVDPGSREVWSATSRVGATGLVVIAADGSATPEWEIDGRVDLHDDDDRYAAHASLDNEDAQHVNGFRLDELRADSVYVMSQAFEGGRHISEDEFVAKNQEWCDRRA
jgi:hypothetical protein